jgi:hypothetical protein
MRLFNLATPKQSTHQSELAADGVILRMIDGASKLDSASWHFLDLVFRALLEETSRHETHE